MRNSIGDKARLQHIYDAIMEIESYVEGIDYKGFAENSMMLHACVKQLEIIGEAANHITQNLRDLFKEIEWREIIDLRNLLVHEYFGIDTKIVWDIIKLDISKLKTRIKIIIENL